WIPCLLSRGMAMAQRRCSTIGISYLDASTRTLKVRLRFDNPDEFLKPNMFAQINIKAGGTESNLVVPSEAIIRTGTQNRVVLSLGDGRFKSVEVTLGSQFREHIVVTSGVEEG
ncbi:efflux RND transporter periplasmic adaptor subunit, partial [Aeromonas sp. QDB06]|uniref:efflux RND transporter periplasmic adaptor subunit n=1 Tax=unclassified Aeromonas TaxID=257493 RepID=UPI003FA4A9F2